MTDQAFLRRPFKIFTHQRFSFAQTFTLVRSILCLLGMQQGKYIIKQHGSDHQASAAALHTQGESLTSLDLQRWSWSKETPLFGGEEKQGDGTSPSLSEKGKRLLGLAHPEFW